MENAATIRSYLSATRLHGEVRVSEVLAGEKPVVRLAETWFHPQGGGQKADRGHIGPAHVLHVVHNGPFVDHIVDSIEGLVPGQSYAFAIDEEWRKLNTIYHSAGHLLASVVEGLFPGLKAVSGHQWPGEARVEFALESVAPEAFPLEDIQAAIDGALSSQLPVRIEGDPFRSRQIAIGGYGPIPCGGTHVNSLGEIGVLRVSAAKKKGDKLRVSYEAFPL